MLYTKVKNWINVITESLCEARGKDQKPKE